MASSHKLGAKVRLLLGNIICVIVLTRLLHQDGEVEVVVSAARLRYKVLKLGQLLDTSVTAKLTERHFAEISKQLVLVEVVPAEDLHTDVGRGLEVYELAARKSEEHGRMVVLACRDQSLHTRHKHLT